MRKKILVLGSSGMLGIEVLKEIAKLNNSLIYATVRKTKDIKLVKKYIGEKKNSIKFLKFQINKNYKKKLKNMLSGYDFVINCIGIIKPYIKDSDPKSVENALIVNSLFPHYLKKCANKKTQIYQIATDCVFDGKDGLYSENFSHNALDVYGKSKSLGEVNSENFYNIRCSIIGNEIKGHKSLMCWFKHQKKNAKLLGFKDHLWNGITTKYFGSVVATIIQNNLKLPNLFHLLPKNIITKYELLKIFQTKFKRDDIIIKKFKSKMTIDRTLKTYHKNINKKIHTSLGYKVAPSIQKLINDI
tara:strand:- start:16680 stop:17582 length:903 start_codon:yes stop_codon:yes gene_type:complete